MTILNEYNSLLLIIDIQEKLLNAAHNKNEIEHNAKIISKAANILNIPTIITEQYPKGLGSTINSLKNMLNDDTHIFEKTSFSAIDNPNIEKVINSYNKKQIIICGIETHICVSQTANALIEKGYEVTLIKDASGSRTEKEHVAGISRMHENKVSIITTEIALFEWLKTSKHEKFKEIQALIK